MTRTESSIRQIDIISNTYSARKSDRNKQFGVQGNYIIINRIQVRYEE